MIHGYQSEPVSLTTFPSCQTERHSSRTRMTRPTNRLHLVISERRARRRCSLASVVSYRQIGRQREYKLHELSRRIVRHVSSTSRSIWGTRTYTLTMTRKYNNAYIHIQNTMHFGSRRRWHEERCSKERLTDEGVASRA